MDVIAVLGASAVIGSLFVAWWALSGPRAEILELQIGDGEVSDLRDRLLQQRASERVTGPMIEGFGAWLRRRLPAAQLSELGRKLARAGSPEGWTVERLLATKVLLTLVLAIGVGLLMLERPSALGAVLVIGAGLIGYFSPNVLLDRRADQRKVAVRRDLSDVIDQLSMMVHAGLGIDAAMARAARSSAGPIAEEFTRVGNDIRVGVDRSVALANLAERVDIPELHTLVAALIQADRLGVPLTQTLQVQAKELRLKRRQFAEEQAMKLPVKMLFPLIFCIFPVLLIVILAPAVISIFEQFN
jgi:tight adherence protein C